MGRSRDDGKNAANGGRDRSAGMTLPSRLAPPLAQVRSAEPAAPVTPPAASASGEEEQVITVTAQRGGACRVRLADRTLTDRELAANAKQWAASNTPLRVIRPRGADYNCMAKIAWRLGDYGVRFFHFVDSSAAK